MRAEQKLEAGPNDSPPRASLLSLPGELRNRIYRFVLVEQPSIEFYSKHDSQDPFSDLTVLEEQHTIEPGLLPSCAQIRNEARPIFFQENIFYTYIQDGKLEPQLGHWFWRRVRRSRRCLGHTGSLLWCNVDPWLIAYWSGDMRGEQFEGLSTCAASTASLLRTPLRWFVP